MMNLNELKKSCYYKVYYNDELVDVFNSKQNAEEILVRNHDYRLIEKECYDYYYDGNYSDKVKPSELTVVSFMFDNITKEVAFKNSVGFSLCVLSDYYENKIDLKEIRNYYYIYNTHIKTEVKTYGNNPLVEKLLDRLNPNNICIISSMISNIYYYGYETEEQLNNIEYLSTHYTADNGTYEISYETKKNSFDICIYDCLTLKGLNAYSIIRDHKSASTNPEDIIKWVTIYELFSMHDITYFYSFYKLLLEDDVVDPVEFIE